MGKLINFINNDYLSFLSEANGKTRDHKDLRFGQRIVNKLKTELGITIKDDTKIFYTEDHLVALNGVLDKLEQQEFEFAHHESNL